MEAILRDELLLVCTSKNIKKQDELFLNHSKHQLLASLNDVYCKHFANKNKWLLRTFYQSMKGIEEERNKDKALIYWNRILAKFQQTGVKRSDLTKLHVDDLEMERLSYVQAYEFEEVAFWKDKVTDKVYAYLNHVYKSASTADNITAGIQAILYVSRMNSMDVFTQKSDMLIVDVLWKILSSVADTCPCPVTEYYLLSRDLYYYKLRKKDRDNRLNYLLLSFLVIAQRDVQDVVIDTGEDVIDDNPKERKHKPALHKMDYLFASFEYDPSLKYQVQKECDYYRRQHERRNKDVVVDKVPIYLEKRFVDVVKLSP